MAGHGFYHGMSAAADLFETVAEGVWVYSAAGGPVSGVIVGDQGVMVVDGQPNAAAAAALAERVAGLGAGPVTWIALTHFHASRWAHLDVFPDADLVTSRKCRTEMLHRGAGELEIAHLRDGVDVRPGGLEAPPVASLAFKSGLSVFLGHRKVDLLHFGAGHSSGDSVVWVQDAGALFAGDLVERGVTPFVGDATAGEWIQTLDKLAAYQPVALIPGRGPVARGEAALAAIAGQRDYVDALWALGPKAKREAENLVGFIRALDRLAPETWRAAALWRERLPFTAQRLMDAAAGAKIPKIWTPDRVRAAIAAGREAFSEAPEAEGR